MDGLAAWRERIEAIGQGDRSEMASADAIAVARDSEPADCPVVSHDAYTPEGFAEGDSVVVMADDYGRDPIVGTFAAADAQRIVIRHGTDDLGTLSLHLPRAGFALVSG